MEFNYVCDQLTTEVMEYHDLTSDGSYCFIHGRFGMAFSIGFDEGKRHRAQKPKIIVQMTKQDEVIKVWPSMLSAAKALNIKHTNISRCARNVKNCHTAGGFKWKFSKIEL